ncbi:hypothetical protein Hanom_Chr15g01381671 [Helianthus anomalus]
MKSSVKKKKRLVLRFKKTTCRKVIKTFLWQNLFHRASTDSIQNLLVTKKTTTPAKEVTSVTEWRPPWRLVTTSPNVVGRTEWRPP